MPKILDVSAFVKDYDILLINPSSVFLVSIQKMNADKTRMKRRYNAMKILIVEDTAPKYFGIQAELKKCGESTFCREKTLADAKRKIEESCKENEIFDLIVTDMNFPNSPGEKEDKDAGLQLIKFVNSLNVLIPMIICSSVRCRVDMENVLGSVHYSINADWETELRKLIDTIPSPRKQ